ncbi:MAG: SUMF1/EgtB/PvdO family nonheme iron enzyme [Acidobacteriota bacterium]
MTESRSGAGPAGFLIDDPAGRRPVDAFPLSLGGTGADIPLPSRGDAGPEAWLELSEGDLFVQPASGAEVSVNGEPLQSSKWLAPGDTVALGGASLRLLADAGRLVLKVAPGAAVPDPLVPPAEPRPGAKGAGAGGAGGKGAAPVVIQPVEFRPTRAGGDPSRPRRWVGVLLALAVLALPAAAAFYLLTARSVEVMVEPSPDRLTISGGWVPPTLGGRLLLRSGTYTVRAEKDGYRTLDGTFEVSGSARQAFTFALDKLPGKLEIAVLGAQPDAPSPDLAAAVVRIDGNAAEPAVAGGTLGPLELPPGAHRVELELPRHRPAQVEVDIVGGGELQRIDIAPQPLWAPVAFTTDPAGARLRLDGEDVGLTPVTVEALEGQRRYEVTLAGHKPRRGSVEVVAMEPVTVGPLRLAPADGNLLLESEPSQASVTVGGVFRGKTPLDLFLSPGRDHGVRLSKAGYASRTETLRVASGDARTVRVELRPLLGKVRVWAAPADAELFVDGESQGAARQVLELSAVPHRIEVKKAGYSPYSAEITPLPGVVHEVEVTLDTLAEAKRKATPRVLRTSEGHELRLIEPTGILEMGASRREPGRRANETLRQVRLSRPFYLGVLEVSNAQMRRFRSEHRSGTVEGESLDGDDRPAVRLTWQDAAAYCNWLSAKEGLPAAYVEAGGTLVPVNPMTTGYRLPSEAEWAWAARRAGSGELLKFPWGSELPIAPGSGNYADVSAQEILPGALPGYRDGFPATAPVGSFSANALGIHNLGGNVAEWAHDFYSIGPGTLSGGLANNPLGPETGSFHVIRGSSWMHSTVTELRLSFRDYGKDPRPDVGFRIARYLE